MDASRLSDVARGASDSVISAEHVRHVFPTLKGAPVPAIADISFAIPRGAFVSIVGPSGCGKSTLLRLIAGLLPPTDGAIRLQGATLAGPSREIGMIFQSPVLLPWKTVTANVTLPAEILGLDPALYRPRADTLLSLVGLADFAGRYPHELSGGMAQRAAIVRALVQDPAILLADEPFGALDAMTREQMNVEFQRIWLDSGKTILLVTHSIAEAVFLSDTVLVLSPRPARLFDTVAIDLPRVRSLDIMASDRFGAYVRRIRQHFAPPGGDPPREL